MVTILEQHSDSSNANSSPATAGPYDDIAEGSLLIALVMAKSDPDITPPANWTEAILQVGNNGEVAIFYRIAGAGEPLGADFALSVNNRWAMEILEIDGADITEIQVDILDKTGGVSSGGAAVTSLTPTTAATEQADEFAVAIAGPAADSGGGVSVDDGYAISADLSETLVAAITANKTLISTGAQDPTISWTNAQRSVAAIATFKITPFVPPPDVDDNLPQYGQVIFNSADEENRSRYGQRIARGTEE